MYPAMRASGHHFTHLVPYPEAVQGTAWDVTAHDVSVLESADRLVLTGGGYTAWTELLAHRAASLGLEVVMSELAYGAAPDGVSRPHPDRLSALGAAGAELFAAYHGHRLSDVVITGTPLLDTLPAWEPVAGHVLLLSTAEAATRDPDHVLRSIGERLRTDGHAVTVRCHPREDRAYWDGFPIDASASAALAARHVTVVIGYPGSAHPVCAALGVPVVAVAPNEALRAALPESHRAVVPTWVTRADQLDLDALNPSAREDVEHVCGPVGGAAQRVVEFWGAAGTA